MKFRTAQVTRELCVWAARSENNVWEVSIDRVMFGWRVHVTYVSDNCYCVDYCAGADLGWVLRLLGAVLSTMEQFDETLTSSELRDLRIFPDYKVRPMALDTECWTEILKVAKASEPQVLERALEELSDLRGKICS